MRATSSCPPADVPSRLRSNTEFNPNCAVEQYAQGLFYLPGTRNREFLDDIGEPARRPHRSPGRPAGRFSSVHIRTIQVCLSTPNPIAVIVGPTPMRWPRPAEELDSMKGRNRDRPLRSDDFPRAPALPDGGATGTDPALWRNKWPFLRVYCRHDGALAAWTPCVYR